MWSLLWHAWHWSETLTWSVIAWCGQLVNGCHAILGPSVASTMLATSLLADTGGSWLWFPSSVPLWRFFQGFSGRSLLLAPVRLWVFLYAPDVTLVCPFSEACPRIVLPLWLCFYCSFHPFSAWCSMHDFGMFHRPPWLCYFVLCMALASHRDLPRDWWVLSGPCATLGQWHAVWVNFASWLCYCVTLGSWCKVVRRESIGSFDPCPGWGYSAQPWFSFPAVGAQASALVSTCALGGYCVAFQASLAIFLGMTCLAPVLAMVCFIDPLGFVEVW
ncbi:hypothetical protein V6N13_110347 [Hibiscus sabdariffa]